MSKSGLFAHFGSKQDLQLATIAAAAARFKATVVDPALALPDGAPRLRALAERYLEQVDTYSGGCFWAATSAEYDDRPGPVRDAIAASLDAWLGELERQARIAGVEHPPPPPRGGRPRPRLGGGSPGAGPGPRGTNPPPPPRLRGLLAGDGCQCSLPPQRREESLRLRPRGRRAVATGWLGFELPAHPP